MITHEILRNYCIFFPSFTSLSLNILFVVFACVEPTIYAMNDKNELLPHHEHTIKRTESFVEDEGCFVQTF